MVTKLKSILEPQRTLPLHKLINLWDIDEDGIVIGVDGSLSSCYEAVELPDVIHMTEGEENIFFENLERALGAVGDNYVITFVVKGRRGDDKKISQYADSVIGSGDDEDGIGPEIVRRKVESFKKMGARRMIYRVYITSPGGSGYLENVAKDRFHFNKLFNPAERLKDVYEERKRKHSEVCENFLQALSAAGINLRALNQDEIKQEFYEHLNPQSSQTITFPKTRDGQTLRSQICLSAALNNFEELTLDGFKFRAVNLYRRPESINFYYIAKFLARLQDAFDVVFTVRYVPDNLDSDSVARKELRFQATLAGATMTREGRQKQETIERMLADTLEVGERIFDFSLCVVVGDKDKEMLDRKTAGALQAIKEIGDAVGVVEDMNHLYLYLAVLPGHWFFNRRCEKFHLSAVSHFLPLHRPWRGTKAPKMIFPTAGGEIIGLDLFDEELPAKHGLIIGSTGSGKSFTTNYILTNFLVESRKNHVVIIDVGGSYRKLCELFGGQYIDIRYDDACAFNPFPRPCDFFIEEKTSDSDERATLKPDPDVLSFLSLVIQKMLKIRALSGNDTMIIERTLVSTYRKKMADEVVKGKNYREADAPRLGDFAFELKEFKGEDEADVSRARGFWKDLGPWVEGRYSILLNNPQGKLALDPGKQLVVFDLQKIKDEPELGPVMFFVVRSAIQSRLADLSLKKIIVIDEGWQFFSDKVGTQLIENLYRTARKYGAAVFSISQSPEDFLRTPAATSIISNAYTKFILRLTAQHGTLKELGLTHQEIEEVKNLEMSPGKYSEVFYKFLTKCIVLRITPNPLDYWICTTNDKDRRKEEMAKKRYPGSSLWEIIKKLAEKEMGGGNE